MKTLYSRHLLASLLVISRKSTCTCMCGLTNLLACTHHSCVVSPPADQHGMLSSPMASSIAADISPVRHPLGMRSSLGLIAFVVVAELGVGIDAVEHDDVTTAYGSVSTRLMLVLVEPRQMMMKSRICHPRCWRIW